MSTFQIALQAIVDPVHKTIEKVLPNLILVLLVLLIGIVAIRVGTRVLRGFLKLTQMPLGLQGIILSLVQIVSGLLLGIITIENLGFKGIITVFSSSALAIGILLAAGGSTLLSDIVAGIFLARDEDFGIGDEVSVGTTQTRGLVEYMDARRVRIRDQAGVLHIIPNSIVERNEWILWSKTLASSPLVQVVETAKRLRVAAKPKPGTTSGPRKVRKNSQKLD